MSEKIGQERAAERRALASERGETVVQDAVVAKLTGIAVQEVDGVYPGSGASRVVGGILDTVTETVTGGGAQGSGQTRGVSVEVGQGEAIIDFAMAVAYGKQIPQVTEAVRKNIIGCVESLTDLSVKEVNITVNDVILPEDQGEHGNSRR
ncbi:hypothetical protein Rxycam_00021 [Rubrobacter xylanophilus DSM 9941]|uniref:Asp23/Gls24 family envelope stress response protein n=1 Tax=Rubrobacter xylanophilus TaxID=49319 RepID=UPI001C6414BA|nr:Asp23/Gls24 family envelope stress response protein [Rubrobacter xylanophilus]QYJ14225.1 hypothetical protein Rxycam_00021 [Rubrobacter xylanophilus DSM 9941]